MKKILATLTVAAALVASAPFAKANAYMELISGGASVIIPAANVGPNGISWVGFVGSWGIDIATGLSSGSLNVGLNDLSANQGVQTSGLQIIYSSGLYGQDGRWVFGASDPGGESLTATAEAYKNNVLYTAGGPLGTQLGATLALGTAPTSLQDSGMIGGTYYLNEVLTIGNPAPGSILPPHFEYANVDATFTVVPDGGLTMAMLGAAMLGLVGIRSKLGKRS